MSNWSKKDYIAIAEILNKHYKQLINIRAHASLDKGPSMTDLEDLFSDMVQDYRIMFARDNALFS